MRAAAVLAVVDHLAAAVVHSAAAVESSVAADSVAEVLLHREENSVEDSTAWVENVVLHGLTLAGRASKTGAGRASKTEAICRYPVTRIYLITFPQTVVLEELPGCKIGLLTT